jgi:hypothetical protein
MVATVFVCTSGVSRVAAGQASAAIDSAVAERATHPMPIDAWLTRPDTIRLSPDQQKQFNALRGKMVDEFVRLSIALNGDREAIRPKVAEMASKYQALIKAILTTEQQAVFAKNITAPPPNKSGE